MTKAFAALLAFSASFIAAPAAALPGGLIIPSDVVSTFDATCGTLGPTFSSSIPEAAVSNKWDEFGRSEGAIGRMWLIGVEGSPLILDISDPAPGKESCSVSAVSHAKTVEAVLIDKFGEKPDVTNVDQQQFGTRIAFRYTKIWTIKGSNQPRKVILVGYSGAPKVRLTLKYGS